ncbi:cobalt transporter CbiM [Pelosinus sp. UFO1]|uniref:cobalt transporter CbiM n=1 Tax=Pelosinus sp. UFO1 TaxID=484770 RepID=UPI0004D0C6FD|nr:cobalt transporter CbiM [Pelosinus sp. UFO1]AIF54007.1 cobalamin (vitamin B12) biosynthesis CbiM protein [Pelosinus sp. UFO1]
MHIPDGYLSPSTCLSISIVMLPVWYKASSVIKKNLDISQVPYMAMGAVFSFLIMMFNIPIPNGTTAHAIGGVMIAIALGPWVAVIGVSVALFIQAIVFGDGGILAFGVNAFNMAFVMPFVGYYIFNVLAKGAEVGSKRYIIAAGIAGYIGLNMAALLAAIEFGIQPLLFTAADGTPLYCPYDLNVTVPAMMMVHLTVAGVVEGIFTAIGIRYITKNSPELVLKG